MNKNVEDDGAWIFVSHSHKDIRLVREVRNELEKHGHKPLMFYLKCLEDDNAQLPYLLRKEIEARTWFVLCDSPNSRQSRWVQQEKDIVKSMTDKVYKEVDILDDPTIIRSRVSEIAKRATVFLSSSFKDEPTAKKISDYLRQANFQVLFPTDSMVAGSNWTESTQDAIELAVGKGFFLVLLSAHSLTSEWIAHETSYALEKAKNSHPSNVIPILLEKRSETLSLVPRELASIQYFDFTTGTLEENINHLISSLKKREME